MFIHYLSSKDNHLDFDAMDDFMNHVLNAIRADGEIAMRVFPPESYVLLSFADRVATEVVSSPYTQLATSINEPQVGDYVTPLLSRAREIANETFLKAAAATFRESWRLVDALQQLDKSGTFLSSTQAEDVVYAKIYLRLQFSDNLCLDIECSNRTWTSTLTKK